MMSTATSSSTVQPVFEEFSPKKVIIQVQRAGSYLLSQWWKILLVAIVFGIAGWLYGSTKKSTYVAEMTFAMDEGIAPGGKSEFASIAEELGLTVNSDAGGVFSSITNIVELMKSRLLIDKTLKSTISIDNAKPICFADFFLDSLNYRKKWMKGSAYPNPDFIKGGKTKQEALFTSGILMNIYETLISKNISIASKGKGTTLVSVKLTSEHELFSKYFLESLIAEVTHYYIEIKTQRAKLNLDFIQKRTDSIRNAYNSALYGRAAFADANISPIRQTASVSGERQQTDVQILKASYTQLVTALEGAKTTLMKERPLIQYLDTPILPLKRNSSNKMKYLVVFAILGGLLATFILGTRRGIRFLLRD